ncbi:hypothetical protein DGo_CA2039 [Deinococcus gobiensis I-0]|uniref:Uncharacterized protein n=2 Tax=Deinococcus TaxID=1298 RepID=H8GY38_DEIGI|nr:hypothetical protein DGo_CA2039 [Deinococcus gobiensis I-0]
MRGLETELERYRAFLGLTAESGESSGASI